MGKASRYDYTDPAVSSGNLLGLRCVARRSSASQAPAEKK